MKIEDIFKENLANDDMSVDNSVWEKINSKMNVSNSVNNSVNHNITESFSQIKNISLATKTIIATFIGIAAIATVVTLYNNSIETTTNDNILQNATMPNPNESDQLINDNNGMSNGENNMALYHNNYAKEQNNHAKEKVELPKENFEVTDNESDFDFEIDDTKDLDNFITTIPDSVMIKTTKQPHTQTATTNYDTMRIKNNYQIKIKIPNVLTPNNDGINDCFAIKNIESYPDNRFIVYNRNGKIVYQKSNYTNEFCGQNLPQGTYFYTLTIRNNGFKKDFKGIIEIIH